VRAVGLASLALVCLVAPCVVAACDEHFPTPPPGGAPVSTGAPAIIEPAARKNASSSPIVFDPDPARCGAMGGVWTANGDLGTISLVDLDERVVRATIPLQQANCLASSSACDVRSIALSPDGAMLAAVDRTASTVSLVDPDRPTLQQTIHVGTHPRACVWDAANPRWLYVALEDDGAVAIVDRVLARVVYTIPVGRLPSGLAVSSSRRELYVPHRIDGVLTIVDLHERTVAADVPLADEPFSDAKKPNGKPFGFESLALTIDGGRAWLPHELLAPTHPFVFNETLFPAISVVDTLQRVEVQTNPNFAPVIDGRKNLFGGINLIGTDGQPEVFSQPCALVMHPNGLIGWGLACASEDLLVFDVNEGIATDTIRNLPGDHPVGLALDDTGQRLFVLSDQSHTLLTIDTATGSLVQHSRVYGEPISLLPAGDNDPVDPDLREGLKLFFRANSAKGAFATTGDGWISCGGCHLDGFESTNARFFEALVPSDPAKDAQIGHVGIAEFFSTEPVGAPAGTHDFLVALLEQGGLAPDRTGRVRTGEIDPNSTNLPAEALQMARGLARVVARDLPRQPTWLQASGVPNPVWDGEYCGGCHEAEYMAWRSSVHAHAASDAMFRFCLSKEQPLQGFCQGCHDPVSARLAAQNAAGAAAAGTGVTCLGCHDVEREIRAGGNGDLVSVAHADWGPSDDHKARALAALDRLRQPEFCGGCHQQFVPGVGLTSIATLDEYRASSYPGTSRCIDCHMQKTNGVADHRFPGGNVYLGETIGDDALVKAQQKNLSGAVQLDAKRVEGGVEVIVTNRGSGHSFPTGVTDIREPWVEVQELDASGAVLVRYGAPGEDGLLAADAARLGTDLASAEGALLYDHQLSKATRVPFELRVPPGGAQALFVAVPSAVPAASLQAVLYYRNVRTTYYRDATGDATGHAPDVVVASTRVEVP
jgi:DNA-binding beta-propeller fold protein YncE